MWIYPGPEWLSSIASWSLIQKDVEPLALEIYNIIWGDSPSPFGSLESTMIIEHGDFVLYAQNPSLLFDNNLFMSNYLGSM